MTIDTRVNSVIHASLRRDLDRAAMLLELPDDLSPARLQALGAHVVWLMDFLHDHHITEDSRLFPLVRVNNPGAVDLIDAMDAEHHAIGEARSRVEQAGRDAEAGRTGAAAALREAVTDPRAVLDPHLEHEERDLPDVVRVSVTEEEWTAFERPTWRARSHPSSHSSVTG